MTRNKDTIWSEIHDVWSDLKSLTSYPSVVWHYTTLRTLEKIITSRGLWATDIDFMNDPRESSYPNSIIEEVSQTWSGKSQQLNDFIRGLPTLINRPELETRTFAACFCGDGDSLPLWRAYGDNTQGVAIGVDTEPLARSVPDDTPAGFFVLAYEPVEQRRAVEKFLEKADELCLLFPDPDDQHWTLDLTSAQVSLLRACFKSKVFESEKEVRFVLLRFAKERDQRIWHRVGRGTLIPYVRVLEDIVPGGVLPIREIMIGSNCEPDLLEPSLKDLLRQSGFDPDSTLLKRSKVPYRLP